MKFGTMPKISFILLLCCFVGLVACQSSVVTPTMTTVATSVPTFSQEPWPFEDVSEIPEGKFLLVELVDLTCLRLCDCVELESIGDAFQFRDDGLYLADWVLTFHNQLLGVDEFSNWASLRKQTGAKLLYAYYYQAYTELTLFDNFPAELSLLPSHPFPYETFESTVISINSMGDVQIKTKAGYAIVPVGSEVVIPEQRSDDCNIQHTYRFVNYGFMKDEDVKFLSDLPQ
jgi:hypothetical protein